MYGSPYTCQLSPLGCDPSVAKLLPCCGPSSLEEAGWSEGALEFPVDKARAGPAARRYGQVCFQPGLHPTYLCSSRRQVARGSLLQGSIAVAGLWGRALFCAHHSLHFFGTATDSHLSLVQSTGGCSKNHSQRIIWSRPSQEPEMKTEAGVMRELPVEA